MRLPRLRLNVPSLALLLVVVLGTGAVVWLIVRDDSATSEEGSPVAQLDRSPRPFTGYQETVEPPDTENPPKCLYPDDERTSPDLPPLSCRHEGNEPPPGLITPAKPGERVDPAAVPEGWTVIDNPLFRLTLAIPPGWWANMRPEGGEFWIYDPVALAQQSGGGDLPGSIVLAVSAAEFEPVSDPARARSLVQQRLATPNAKVGEFLAATWEDPGFEGLARIVRLAFAGNGFVIEFKGYVGDIERSDTEIQGDIDAVRAILATVTPY